MKKPLYPCEPIKGEPKKPDPEPMVINTASGICPNYEDFPNWDVEKLLVFCNLD